MLTYWLNGNEGSQNQGEDEGREVCIANISPQERLKRLIGGIIPFVMALGILAWLLANHAERLWRLPLFFFFAGATVGFFQWRDKT